LSDEIDSLLDQVAQGDASARAILKQKFVESDAKFMEAVKQLTDCKNQLVKQTPTDSKGQPLKPGTYVSAGAAAVMALGGLLLGGAGGAYARGVYDESKRLKMGGAGEHPQLAGYPAAAEESPGYESIRRGSRVTIVTPHGQNRIGTAVMQGPHGWVLNLGGAHGTPGIASPENTVRVTHPRT
jgi:hypothetical protein